MNNLEKYFDVKKFFAEVILTEDIDEDIVLQDVEFKDIKAILNYGYDIIEHEIDGHIISITIGAQTTAGNESNPDGDWIGFFIEYDFSDGWITAFGKV